MTEIITHGWGRSALGNFLTAASADGIVAIEFADDRAAAVAKLAGDFPAAQLVADQATVAGVADAIDRPGMAPDPALDPRGTPEELRVWQALRRIPAGTTTTYGALAAAFGQPFDARAVAAACAANRIAVLIPCHRVVKKDGSLSGYRWGYGRKRALIDREAQAAPFALA